jgi:hypothetical protein
MNLKNILGGAALAIAVSGCNPAANFCQKEYDCRDELKRDLEDDYPDVCAAQLEGQNNALRQNAEQECEDLANAQATYVTCLGNLSCDDLKKAESKEPGKGGTACDEPGKDLVTKTKDAGAKCDANGDT